MQDRMTKFAHKIKKHKYLSGSIIIIIALIIFIKHQYQKNDIYIFYDKKSQPCNHTRHTEKEEYSICFNNNSYSFKIKETDSIKVIKDLENIKLTSLEKLLNSSQQNQNFFLVIKKSKGYEVLPVKIYQDLSRHY